MNRGYWNLSFTVEPTDETLQHISEQIKIGNTEGEILNIIRCSLRNKETDKTYKHRVNKNLNIEICGVCKATLDTLKNINDEYGDIK